jgi:hypothetical protein
METTTNQVIAGSMSDLIEDLILNSIVREEAGASTMKPFSQREVSITLTGAEWTAILARLLLHELSAEGERVYLDAVAKMQVQLLDASKS